MGFQTNLLAKERVEEKDWRTAVVSMKHNRYELTWVPFLQKLVIIHSGFPDCTKCIIKPGRKII